MPKPKYTLQSSVDVDQKIAKRIKNLLVRTVENGCTLAEAQTAEAKLQELYTKFGLDCTSFELLVVEPPPRKVRAKKEKAHKVPDYILDPPIRAGVLYDDAPQPNIVGRYIYLQEDDQELLDRFCQSWLDTYEQDRNFFLTLDLETHGLNPVLEENEILLHGISWDGYSAIVFEHQKFDLTLYKQVLNTIPINNHNIKFDFRWLIHFLGVHPIILWDTMVCAQIGWAGIFPEYQGKKYSLDNVVQQMLPPYKMSKTVRKEFYTKRAGTGFSRSQIEYGVRDAILTHKLVEPQMIRLHNHGLMDLWLDLELPLLQEFVYLELEGVPVNMQTALRLYKEKETELIQWGEELNQQIRELPDGVRPRVGPKGNYNPMSAKQLPVILNAIGIRVMNTEAETLKTAFADSPHPILKQVIEYRTLFNQISKLLKKMCAEFIDPRTNKIYPAWSTCGAETGRLAVQSPPLHQIQEWARCIVEAPEGWILLDRDYSQFEFRACAALTGEPRLIKLFEDRARILPDVRGLVQGLGAQDPDDFCKKLFSHKAKDVEAMAPYRARMSDADLELLKEFTRLDIHRANAASVFNIPTDEVDGAQRTVCKTLGYAILYGSQIPTLRAQLAQNGYIYSAKDCQGFFEAFFKSLPRVEKFILDTHKRIKDGHWISTPLGRKRFFALPPRYMANKYKQAVAAAERESVNYFFQASNADATKRSMLVLTREWRELYPADRRPSVIINVHDELVVLCPEELADEVDARMEQVMIEQGELAVDGKCPIEVSGGRFKVWKK